MFKDNVWRFPLPQHLVESLKAGDYIMDDLDTLGWVIVKAFQFDDFAECLVFFNDVQGVIGRDALRKWHSIQTSSEKQMQFPHLHPTGDDARLLEKIGGCRMMAYMKGDSRSLLKKTTLQLWFENNLCTASTVVKRNTPIQAEYEFSGHNLLGTRGYVPDQAIHSDYKFISAPGYESPDEKKKMAKRDKSQNSMESEVVGVDNMRFKVGQKGSV